MLVAVTDLSSDHVETFITGLFKESSSGYDPCATDEALRGLSMLSHIADRDARVLYFASSLFERLDVIVYMSLHDNNKEKTVALMCEYVSLSCCVVTLTVARFYLLANEKLL